MPARPSGAAGRRLRIAAVALAAAVALFAAVGFWLVPPLAKSQLQRLLSEELGRPVSIARIEFNPFDLRAAVGEIVVGGRGGTQPLLSVARLEVDASWSSLVQRAPVIDGLRVAEPHLRLARDAQGRYDVQDLIDRWLARPPRDPNEPPARFAVANIELAGGRVDFDDAPVSRSHRVTDVEIKVPFVSSLPVDQHIHVHPKFAARVNGSLFEAGGQSRPFSETRESTLELSVASTDLKPYVQYLPVELPVVVESMRFAGRARVEFAQPRLATPTMKISAEAALSGVDLRDPEGAPLLSIGALKVESAVLEPLAGRHQVGRITVEAPALAMRRRAGEPRYFARLLGAIEARAARQSAQPAPPQSWTIDELRVEAGKLDLVDEQFQPRPLAVAVESLSLVTGRIDSALRTAIPLQLAFDTRTGEKVEVSGEATPLPFALQGKVSVQSIALKNWWWLAQPHVAAELTDGVLGLRADVRVASGDAGTDLALGGLAVELTSLRLRQGWDKAELLRLPKLSLGATDVDLRARTVRVGSLLASGGVLSVARDAQGRLNLSRLVEGPSGADAAQDDASAAKAAPATQAAPAAAPAGSQPQWSVQFDRLALERFAASMKDAKAGPTAGFEVSNLSLQAEDIGTQRGKRGKVSLKAGFGQRGSLETRGQLGLVPLTARLRVEVRELAMLPMQPYLDPFVDLVVSSGRLSASGDVALDVPAQGRPAASYKGSVALADFAALDRGAGADLLRWKALQVGGVDFVLEPLKVDVGDVTLSDFYSRLIISAEGRFNLQDVLARRDGQGQAAAAAARTQVPTQAAAPTAPTAAPAPAPSATTTAAPPIRLG